MGRDGHEGVRMKGTWIVVISGLLGLAVAGLVIWKTRAKCPP